MQELRAGDLRQTDRAHVARIAAEHLVHLFVHALRLHRHVVEVRLAVHRLLALLAIGDPCAAVLQLAGGFPFLSHFNEQFERGFRVRHDAEVRSEHAADLRRLDVHVHELAALRINLDAARVAVRPTIADAEHEVGGEHRGVAVAVRSLQADHAGHQRMVVGNRAPRHQRRDHRHADGFGEFDQQVLSGCVQHAATRDDQRFVRVVQQRERGFDLLACCLRLVDRQRLVRVDVEFDFGELHVDRQVDQHRTRTARAHQVESLLEHARHQCRFAHGDGPLGDRLGDRFDIDGLKSSLYRRARGAWPVIARIGIESA